jgi:hypothetical protein
MPMKNYTGAPVVIRNPDNVDGPPVYVYLPCEEALQLELDTEDKIVSLPYHVPKDGILIPVRAPRVIIGIKGHSGPLSNIIVRPDVAKFILEHKVPGFSGVHVTDSGVGAIRNAHGSICGTSGLVCMVP